MKRSRPFAAASWLVPCAWLLAGAAVPALVTSGFALRLASLICVYAILCSGFNLLYGVAGQISMGQQAFFSLGAYAFALLYGPAAWPFAFALPASIATCAGAALVIGIPLLRLRTHYLAMATLCFGLVLAGVASRWIGFTGGTSGLPVAALRFGGHPLTRGQLYYLILATTAAVVLLQNFIIGSHLGRALSAIKGDETAAASLGVNVIAYKLRIFVIAAVMAGVSGICLALLSRHVDPSFGEFPILVTMLTVAVVGGLGTRYGPLLGSIVVVLAPQWLASFGELQTLLYGAALLAFLMFLPHGLAGTIRQASRRLTRVLLPKKAAAIAHETAVSR